MTEILNLLSVSWPGLLAVLIWKGPDYLNVWMTSRRVRLRIGASEIDASSPTEAYRLLGEVERLATTTGDRPQITRIGPSPY